MVFHLISHDSTMTDASEFLDASDWIVALTVEMEVGL